MRSPRQFPIREPNRNRKVKDSEVSKLIDEATAIEAKFAMPKEKADRLKEIKNLLQVEALEREDEHEPGKKGGKHWIFESKVNQVTVTMPDPSLKPEEEDIEACRLLAGPVFAKLFDRTVSFSPAKSFRDLVSKLLTPAKAAKVIEICERPSAARVAIKPL